MLLLALLIPAYSMALSCDELVSVTMLLDRSLLMALGYGLWLSLMSSNQTFFFLAVDLICFHCFRGSVALTAACRTLTFSRRLTMEISALNLELAFRNSWSLRLGLHILQQQINL